MGLSIQEINETYNALKIKDMPRHEFVKQVQELTSQSGVQRDLRKIMGQKQTMAIRGAREKQKIDRALENVK